MGFFDSFLGQHEGLSKDLLSPFGGENQAGILGGGRFVPESSEFKDKQLNLASQLEARARGEGTSIAELQLRDALEKNVAQNFAQAQASRGLNPALAARQALSTQADLGQELAAKGALLRAQEQESAQRTLAEVLGSGRSGDLRFQDIKGGNFQKGLENRKGAGESAGKFIASMFGGGMGGGGGGMGMG